MSQASARKSPSRVAHDIMSDKKNSDGSVPQAVVSRLSLYLRELQQLLRNGSETVSSTQLGRTLGFTDAQVRKDLAFFGAFGYPGLGYRCEELVAEIKRILGTDRRWPVVIVGIGNLGDLEGAHVHGSHCKQPNRRLHQPTSMFTSCSHRYSDRLQVNT